MKTTLFLLLLLIGSSTVMAAPSCVGISPTTQGPTVVQWTGTCLDIQDPSPVCWMPSLPTASSTAVIGTNATMGLSTPVAVLFDVFLVANLVIAPGATLVVGAGAIQATNCILIQGSLILNSTGTTAPVAGNFTQSPKTSYLPDPLQPEGTDCLYVPVGFTPRMCGPAQLLVTGTVTLLGLYASSFASGIVAPSGTFALGPSSFMWGNITNNGLYVGSGYTYQHGFLFNYGVANFTSITFDVWATSYAPGRMPLWIANHGTMNMMDMYLAPTNADYGSSHGTYQAILENYGIANFFGGTGQSNYDFDVFNYGQLTWSFNREWFGQFFAAGTFLNKGVMTVSAASVYLNTFHSIGGTIVTQNGGTISFGTSATTASAKMRVCQLVQGLPAHLKKRAKASGRRRQMARHLGHEPVMEQRGDCWWYSDWCYHFPYIWSPPPELETAMSDSAERTGHGAVLLRVQELLADSELDLEAPCSVRYHLERTEIRGDGSGSIVANYPVQIDGFLRLGAGAKWYVAAERRAAPFHGGGTVTVGRGAALFLGISAELKHHGTVVVLRGGQLAIPRHASVTLSNHTLITRRGAVLHVDGTLSLLRATRDTNVVIDHCGVLDGTGEVVMDEDGLLSCTSEKQRYGGLHRN